jgi:hypothetical protein
VQAASLKFDADVRLRCRERSRAQPAATRQDDLQGTCDVIGRRHRIAHALEAATRVPLAHDVGVQAVRDGRPRGPSWLRTGVGREYP